MCDYHHAWPREWVWVCVCDPGLWSFTLQPRYKRPKHKNTVTHAERECRRNLLLKIAETPLNTSLCWQCRCSVCVCVCVCVCSPRTCSCIWQAVRLCWWVDGEIWTCLSQLLLSHMLPSKPVCSPWQRKRTRDQSLIFELWKIIVQWLKSHATHWGNTDKSNLSKHTHTFSKTLIQALTKSLHTSLLSLSQTLQLYCLVIKRMSQTKQNS